MSNLRTMLFGLLVCGIAAGCEKGTKANGTDATSDNALKTLIILTAITSVAHSPTHRVCRFEPRRARHNS
jgi:hypothetical protein